MIPKRSAKKKRINWKECAENWRQRYEESNLWMAERKKMLFHASNELAKYRLICDWACQRIEKLEANDSEQFRVEHASSVLWKEIAEGWQRKCGKLERERNILLNALFEVQAENIMQGEDILQQREELTKLRGKPEERISCNR